MGLEEKRILIAGTLIVLAILVAIGLSFSKSATGPIHLNVPN